MNCLPVCTVTVKLHSALLPDPSSNVYSTTVSPTGNMSPGKWVDEVSTKPERSTAEGSTQLIARSVVSGLVNA